MRKTINCVVNKPVSFTDTLTHYKQNIKHDYVIFKKFTKQRSHSCYTMDLSCKSNGRKMILKCYLFGIHANVIRRFPP